MSETPERVTYATLAGGQSDEFQRRWDLALDRLRPALGGRHGHLIGGQEHGLREADGDVFEDHSPIDRRRLLGRFSVGTAEDVASVVVFLAGPESGYVTGATIDINGGLHMS